MDQLRAWIANLSPAEKALIMVGVPAVAVAAIISTSRGKKAKAAADAATAEKKPEPPGLSAPQSFSNPGDSFELLRLINDFRNEIHNQQDGNTSAGGAPGDPCTPGGASWNPTACSNTDLVRKCVALNGPEPLIEEMRRRRVSVNTPELAGTRCGELYAVRLLEHGANPYWNGGP